MGQSRRRWEIIVQSPLSRCLLLFAVSLVANPGSDAQAKLAAGGLTRVRPSHTDQFLECVQRVYGKQALVDTSFQAPSPLSPWPGSIEGLTSVLKTNGVRSFISGNFVFLIPAKFFPPRPPDLSPYLKTLSWNKISIATTIRPSSDLTASQTEEIGKQVFAQARLIPLEVSLLPAGTSEVTVELNVYLLVAKSNPNGATPVIAWINGFQTFLTGRLVYGEILGDKYTVMWDSPLFNSRGQVYFKNVTGDGWQQIVIQSQNCGNQCTDEI